MWPGWANRARAVCALGQSVVVMIDRPFLGRIRISWRPDESPRPRPGSTPRGRDGWRCRSGLVEVGCAGRALDVPERRVVATGLDRRIEPDPTAAQLVQRAGNGGER